MEDKLKVENAVAAIRVSSVKQGLQGDSPEDQREQLQKFADFNNFKITKFFDFRQSASGEIQPSQEAIDYCKDPHNDIQLFLIKSIDRFTRGGSFSYDLLKRQLTQLGIRLLDTHGVIGNRTVNTLEHLDYKYPWSEFSPTRKSEILTAEDAKDEVRTILTRLIGSEIRYSRLGFYMRQAPPGYVTEKVQTDHGTRPILKPHPTESYWFREMFNLRARGDLTDQEIVEKINLIGFKSKRVYHHDKANSNRIIGFGGEKPLTVKQFQRYIQKPIYAGINDEIWLKGDLVKVQGEPLVSIELFNQANKGKVVILEDGDRIQILKNRPPDWQLRKIKNNPAYPFKKFVFCPECRLPLRGSASRGKSGNHFAAYHCNRGHYFRVPEKEFNETIASFVKEIKFNPDFIQRFREIILEEWEKRRVQAGKESITVEQQVVRLKEKKQLVAEKILVVSSEAVIKVLEGEIEKIDKEISIIVSSRNEVETQELDIQAVINYCRYFMEHLEELVLTGDNPERNAVMFSLLFDETPTYEDLKSGTPKLASLVRLNREFETSPKSLGEPDSLRMELELFNNLTRIYKTFTQIGVIG